jgi:hypothetical protein
MRDEDVKVDYEWLLGLIANSPDILQSSRLPIEFDSLARLAKTIGRFTLTRSDSCVTILSVWPAQHYKHHDTFDKAICDLGVHLFLRPPMASDQIEKLVPFNLDIGQVEGMLAAHEVEGSELVFVIQPKAGYRLRRAVLCPRE